MDYETVFSGRGFVDGRGLSSMTGNSSLAAVVDRGDSTSDDNVELVKAIRRRSRLASRSLDVEPDAPIVCCACGCGEMVQQRVAGGGRPRRYADKLHQSRAWMRAKYGYSKVYAPRCPALPPGRVFGRRMAARSAA